jgi:hypothetical protein
MRTLISYGLVFLGFCLGIYVRYKGLDMTEGRIFFNYFPYYIVVIALFVAAVSILNDKK